MKRILTALTAVVALGACGSTTPGEQSSPTQASTTATVPATTTATTTSSAAVTTATTTATTATPTTVASTTTSGVVALEQPAVWPAPSVVFDTPEAAATDFVSQVFGVTPVLGEFRQGDSRSGEIEVFSPGEGENPTEIVQSLLLLRQLGPSNAWFVLAAVSDTARIAAPTSGGDVPDGTITVSGEARGFEGTIVVTAYPAGSTMQLDQAIAHGGALEALGPYSAELDLSAADPGDVVMIVVRGDTGLDNDPGNFSAIPVVVSATLPQSA